MKLRIKGKQCIYTHECNPADKGQALSKEEMQIFVTDCLIKSYMIRGTECIRHTANFNSKVDFSYNKLGKTVCGIVIYGLSKEEKSDLFSILLNKERFKNTFPQLYKGYHEYNSYPVFYFAKARCLDSKDGSPIAGGRYTIEWTPKQPLYSEIPTSGPNISEFEMYKGYARSWETGDVSFIEKYVWSWFDSVSDLSFDCTTSKAELIALIKSRHESWKLQQISVKTELVKDTDRGYNGILILLNGIPTGFVVLRFSNHRISRSETRVPPKNYVEWTLKYELYQTHGDHHAPFVEDKILRDFIIDMTKSSTVYMTLDDDVNLNCLKINTRVAALRYPSDRFSPNPSYIAIIAYNPLDEENQIVSCYPYLQGTPIEVEITDILEWDNKLEATIQCTYFPEGDKDNEFSFHFFATDYYLNKNKYRIGDTLCIALAASSGNVKEASRGFSLEGQEAIDFLAKVGKEPNFDENGNVEPVKLSTEKLVAFLPQDDKCPDMADFQSPVKDLTHDYFYCSRVDKGIIKLHNDPDIEVPLYFNSGLTLHEGDPIMGWLWLSGRIADPKPTKISVCESEISNDLAKIASTFIDELSKLKYESIVDITPACNILRDLSIPDDKNWYAIRVGSESSFYYELFIANSDELASVQNMLDSEGHIDLIQGMEFSHYAEKTKEEIKGTGKYSPWQKFLIDISRMLMPCNSDSQTAFFYILTKEAADKVLHTMGSKLNSQSILPFISEANISAGNFSVMSWDRGRLMRMVFVYYISNEHISFYLDGYYEIVEDLPENDSDSSNIQFRD